MAIILGQRSLAKLVDVHPDLVRVVKRAAALADKIDDFSVIEGVRSREGMCVNYGKGRTAAQCIAKGVPASYAQPKLAKVTWLNNPFASKHGKHSDGYSHAVDAVPYPVDWNDLPRFDRLARIFRQAAAIEGVKIRWGADWNGNGRPREKGETDSPHFELVR